MQKYNANKQNHTLWSLINYKDISNKYWITLRNKFDDLQEISETLTLMNNDYKNLVNTHMEAAAECIPTKIRAKHRVPWETLADKKKKKKRDMKTTSLHNKRNPRRHKKNKYNKFKVRSIKLEIWSKIDKLLA